MKQFSEELMKRTGGWYIVIVIAISQISGLPGAIPGWVSLQMNVELNENISLLFSRLVPTLIAISQLTLFGAGWWITSSARRRLNKWSKGEMLADTKLEFTAWKEITNLTSRIGVVAFIVNFVLIVLPPLIIALPNENVLTSIFQPNSIDTPAPIYILFGGLASVLGATILTLLILDRLTLPPRLILLPKSFESQL